MSRTDGLETNKRKVMPAIDAGWSRFKTAASLSD